MVGLTAYRVNRRNGDLDLGQKISNRKVVIDEISQVLNIERLLKVF